MGQKGDVESQQKGTCTNRPHRVLKDPQLPDLEAGSKESKLPAVEGIPLQHVHPQINEALRTAASFWGDSGVGGGGGSNLQKRRGCMGAVASHNAWLTLFLCS